jgi:hypothetical protein
MRGPKQVSTAPEPTWKAWLPQTTSTAVASCGGTSSRSAREPYTPWAGGGGGGMELSHGGLGHGLGVVGAGT